MIKKFINLFILICLVSMNFVMPVLALELDTSVDDEIRRNYNPSKLELDALPPLPKTNSTPSSPTKPISSTTTTLPPKTAPVTTPSSKPTIGVKTLPGNASLNDYDSTAIKIKKGTQFRVRSNNVLSDYMREDTRISFISNKPVTQTYVTVPSGTIFKGLVLDSHPPQIGGNGGLIVLMVDSMVYKGKTCSVNAKITKANRKRIYINNIKGQRGYLKGISKSTQPGRSFYHKMVRATTELADGPFTMLLTPFTVVAGVVVYGVNIIGSPVFAIFSKGKRITIPAGSEFEIKFLDDVYL